MKKVTLLIAMFLAFAVVAFAQSDTQGSSSSSQTSSPSATQGSSTSTGSSSGSMGTQGSSSSQGTMGSQGSSSTSQGTMGSQGSSSSSQGTMGSQGSSSTQGSAATKGEKQHKVKGCIRSEGGSYVLEDGHGKTFALNSTEDLSAHVGHEVVVHGTESAGGGSAVSGGSAGAGEKTINVSKIDMVSDTCKMGGAKHEHGKTGTSGTSGTTGTSGTSGSSSTNPPQK